MKSSATYFVFIALFCLIIPKYAAEAKDSFGPYNIIIRNIDKCRVAASQVVDTDREITNTLKIVKVTRTKVEVRGNVIIPQDIQNMRGTITVDFWRDGGYKPFINKKFNNPCEEQLILPILKSYITIEKNCLIKMGNYSLSGLEPNKLAKKMIGENFFYEKISSTVAFYSKKGLVFCLKIALESMLPPKVTKGGSSTKTQ